MAIDPNNINSKTLFDIGFPISQNFILEHMTSGAIHPASGMIFPFLQKNLFTADMKNTPLWKVVQTLSAGGIGIIEPLLKEFSSTLLIKQAFNVVNTASEIQHQFGKGFDIQIAGSENDLAYLTKSIASIANKASSITLNTGTSSWIHIGVDTAKLASNFTSSKVELPKITSCDLVNNIVVEGVYGFRASGWQSNDSSLNNALYDAAGNLVDEAGNILEKIDGLLLDFQ